MQSHFFIYLFSLCFNTSAWSYKKNLENDLNQMWYFQGLKFDDRWVEETLKNASQQIDHGCYGVIDPTFV